jgi:hypothetical protein
LRSRCRAGGGRSLATQQSREDSDEAAPVEGGVVTRQHQAATGAVRKDSQRRLLGETKAFEKRRRLEGLAGNRDESRGIAGVPGLSV